MTNKTFTVVGVAAIALIVAVALLAANGNDEAEATDTDGAFISAMVPHHESAIEMAKMATESAEHPQVKQLAETIVDTQEKEIGTLESAHQRLYGEPVGRMSHDSLGLDESMMGMDSDMSVLESADPFDRVFIDMMVAHHQGAVRMAQVELAEGEDQQVRAIAEDVIEAQSREIEQMNAWRTRWYGSPAPSGGVPDEEETMSSMEESGSMGGMEH